MDFKQNLQNSLTASFYLSKCKVQFLGNMTFIKPNYLSLQAANELILICAQLDLIISIQADKHSNDLLILFTDAS